MVAASRARVAASVAAKRSTAISTSLGRSKRSAVSATRLAVLAAEVTGAVDAAAVAAIEWG